MRLRKVICESASQTTALQETLFAVGWAIYQMKGKLTKEMMLDGDIFAPAYDNYVRSDVQGIDVYDLADTNTSYVNSVVSSVNALARSPHKIRKGKIYRGRGIMDMVYKEAHRLLTKQGVKLNADKWNPGDVWISDMSSLPTFQNISELNTFVSDGIKSGRLVPISLKKTRKAKVVLVSSDDPPPIADYKSIKAPRTLFNTGITILTSRPDVSINVRSFRISIAASITTELIVAKSDARHGKATPSKMINKLGIYQDDKRFFDNNADDVELMKSKIIQMWSQLGVRFGQDQIDKMWSIRERNKQYVENKAGYWRSIINSLQIAVFLDGNRAMANEFVHEIITDASSIGEYSSSFIKIY